jgi:hypothetical protein
VPRLVRELLVTVTVSLALTVVVAIVGTRALQSAARPDERTTSDEGGCLDTPVRALSASIIEGHARLCVDDNGLRPTMRVSGLRAGEVYTVWLAYFENPSACLISPCQMIDLLGDDPLGVLGRVDGAVVSAVQEFQLQGNLRDLRVASGAQITLVLFAHGSANAEGSRARARQLLSIETPELGAPLAGVIADGGRAWPLAQAIFVLR